ncbi:MAG: hypothetical protein ACRD8O_06565 [Bryobacteraceae bacterium]
MKRWFAVTAMLMTAAVARPQNEPGVQEAIRFERDKAARSAAWAKKEGKKEVSAPAKKQPAAKKETIGEAIRFERHKLTAATAQERQEQMAARTAGTPAAAE